MYFHTWDALKVFSLHEVEVVLGNKACLSISQSAFQSRHNSRNYKDFTDFLHYGREQYYQKTEEAQFWNKSYLQEKEDPYLKNSSFQFFFFWVDLSATDQPAKTVYP